MNIELIANIARAAARGEAIKVAFDWGDIGGEISKGWGSLSDDQKHSIIGGIGGLGIGALGGGLLGGGKGALIGALAGGGIGAYGGLKYDPLLNYFNELTGNKKEEAPASITNMFKTKPKDKKVNAQKQQDYQDPYSQLGQPESWQEATGGHNSVRQEPVDYSTATMPWPKGM